MTVKIISAETLSESLKKLIAIELDARNFGFEWPNVDMILDQALSETAEIRQAIQAQESAERIQEEIGDLLHTAISLCMFLGYNVDQTLEGTTKKFARRMNALKSLVQKHGLQDLNGQNITFMLELWQEVKRLEANSV